MLLMPVAQHVASSDLTSSVLQYLSLLNQEVNLQSENLTSQKPQHPVSNIASG